jgi:hypothetical protein
MQVNEGEELLTGGKGWTEALDADRVAAVAVEESRQLTQELSL